MNELAVMFVIACESTEILRQVEESARDRIGLENSITKVFRHYAGGVEKRVSHIYKLGDYFGEIELRADEWNDVPSLKIIFHIRKGVDSYWKDLAMAVLRSIMEGLAGVSLTSISQPA